MVEEVGFLVVVVELQLVELFAVVLDRQCGFGISSTRLVKPRHWPLFSLMPSNLDLSQLFQRAFG